MSFRFRHTLGLLAGVMLISLGVVCFRVAANLFDLPPVDKKTSADRPDEVTFSPDELEKLLQHSPLGNPPLDKTNSIADNWAASELGQRLFFDTRFSANRQISCGTCHRPDREWSDGKPLA